MSVVNGSDLYMWMDGELVAYSTSYTLNLNMGTRPGTNKGSGLWRKSLPGLFSSTASCDGLYVFDNSVSRIVNAMLLRNPVTLHFGSKLTGTNAIDPANEYFTGSYYITNFELSARDADNSTYTASFEYAEAFAFRPVEDDTPNPWDVAVEGVYYVKTGGNDLADGMTDATAWATLTKVNATSFNPGDTINFKRGNTWRGTLTVPSSGTAGNHIVFDAYGVGAKPKILGSSDLSSTSSWELHSGNVWKTTATTGAYSAYVTANDVSNLIFNNEALYGVREYAIVDLSAQGEWFFNTADNLVYLYSSSNPGAYYSHIECAGVFAEVNIRIGNLKHHITIRNIDTRYSGNHGIYADRANNVIIEFCEVSWIGGWIAFTDHRGVIRQGNGIGVWTESTRTHDVTVRFNRVHQCYDAGISPQGSGVSFDADNILMYYNIISNCHYSYETWSTGDDTMDNVVFYNNTCVNAGYSWSYAQRPDSGNDSDVMIWTTGGVHNNVSIKNNIFSGSRNKSLQLNMTVYSKLALDYNLYDCDVVAITDAGTFTTLASWRTQSSQEANSVTGDPLFVSSSNFHLQSGSPAINEGTNVGLTEDYDGVTVGNPPEIGAYEYV